MPPEQLILTLLVEYMKCVTYELEVTIPLYRNQKGISLSVTAYPLDIIIILDAILSSTARPCCYDTWQSTGRLRHVPRE